MRSRSYGWYVLGLLASANFLNYGTRNVVFTMYDDLRGAFAFSNAELGLLGSVFMVSHALVTVPFGWAADRTDRRRVIAAGILVWSVANLASALASGLGTMLVSRAAAGIGTAACVPVANALLCDVFPSSEKARTVSFFNLGLFLGGGAGFAIGATLGFPYGFLALAGPGLLMLVAVARVDVPARSTHVQRPAVSWRAFWRDLGGVWRIPTMRWLIPGSVLMAFAAGGFLAWFADFLVQTRSMSPTRATAMFGAVALTGGLAGVLAGGIIGDRLQRARPYGRLATMSLGFAASVPFGIVALFIEPLLVFLPAAWLMMFFITWYHGPMAAVVDDLVPRERAATAQASFIFLMHLVGTAPSSFVVGLLVDEVGVRYALLLPLGSVVAAAAVLAGGWRHVEADCAITARS